MVSLRLGHLLADGQQYQCRCPAVISAPTAASGRQHCQPAPSAASPCARTSRSRRRHRLHRAVAAQAEPAKAGKTTVGFLGLGIMGTAAHLASADKRALQSKNLVKDGYEVTVWNRNPDKTKPLQEAGAKVGKSIKEVVESCEIIVAMVSDPAAAKQVANEVAQHIGKGHGYVDASTIDAGSAQQIAKQINGAGALYLEAPVSGTKQPAEQGQLIFLCGGDKELYERAAPLLDVMGKAKYYLGPAGQGAKMKLVINMIMGSMVASLAEGITLAQASDLPAQDLLDALFGGAMAAPVFKIKGPPMASESRGTPTAFPLKHQKKDLVLACDLAQELKVQMPVAKAAAALYEKAVGSGLGDEDMSAVIKEVLKESNQK